MFYSPLTPDSNLSHVKKHKVIAASEDFMMCFPLQSTPLRQ